MKKIMLPFLLFAGTLQAQITTFPFEENFDAIVPQSSVADVAEVWTQFNLNADLAYWDVLANSTSFPGNAHSAPNAMHMSFDFTHPNNDWLLTPAFTLEVGATYKVSFWYRSISGGFPGISEKMAFHIGNGADPANMTSAPLWSNEDITSQIYELVEVEFVAPGNGSEQFFGFHGYSNAEQFLLAMDDFLVEKTSTSSTEDTEQEIAIFPNPTADLLSVSGLKDASILMIYNIQGQQVLTTAISNQQSISLADLPTGIYHCEVWQGNKMAHQKVVKL